MLTHAQALMLASYGPSALAQMMPRAAGIPVLTRPSGVVGVGGPVVVVVAEMRATSVTGSELNRASYAQISAAFARARLRVSGLPREIDGGWLGGIRVTRTSTSAYLLGREYKTVAVGVYGWPASGPWSATARLSEPLVSILRASVAASLDENDIPGSWVVTTAAYQPAVNGPLSSWANSTAAQTRTRDAPSDIVDLLTPDDNQLGPVPRVGPVQTGDSSIVPLVIAGGVGLAVLGAGGWFAIDNWQRNRAVRALRTIAR